MKKRNMSREEGAIVAEIGILGMGAIASLPITWIIVGATSIAILHQYLKEAK